MQVLTRMIHRQLLLLVTVCTTVMGPPMARSADEARPIPAATRSAPLDPPDVLEVLNPIYFRVALAAVKEDRALFDTCADQLAARAKEDAKYLIPASYGRLVIFEALQDKERFLTQFADVCGQRFDGVAKAQHAEKRMLEVLQRLPSEHADWEAEALLRGLKRIGPEPDGVSVLILEHGWKRLPIADQAPYFATFLEGANIRRRDAAVSLELREYWLSQWHAVVKVAMDNYTSHLWADKLWPLTVEYFDEFGAKGPHTRELLTKAMRATSVQRAKMFDKYDPAILPAQSWLNAAHEQVAALPSRSAHQNTEFESAWREFVDFREAPLTLGPIPRDELRRDRRLRQIVTYRFTQQKVTLGEACEFLAKQIGIAVRVGSATNPNLIASGPWNMEGPVLGAMELMAFSPILKGQWHRVADGYEYHSSLTLDEQQAVRNSLQRDVALKMQAEHPNQHFKIPHEGHSDATVPGNSNMGRWWLIGINVVVVGIVLAVVIRRRRGGKPASSAPLDQ